MPNFLAAAVGTAANATSAYQSAKVSQPDKYKSTFNSKNDDYFSGASQNKGRGLSH
jgi:hypothetical protein